MSDRLVIPMGQTWSGTEYIEITKRVRKGGYRVRGVRKTWRGHRITLFSEEAWDAGEVISKIRANLLPIFEIPESVKEEIKNFCERA
ncbi:hypothetical protein [Archaeoglobus neptunius]|uniref:hypothetical protein n=1 Tax=Archaeoglobus neptunius TaxID=2798580 RepID=UPI0019286844|nr:hypothetical protein [Archaeoglobus neptunius]